MKELVSHGYIVFAIDHLDGSCGYTGFKDGTKQGLNVDKVKYSYKDQHEMVNKREQEISSLIDEISKENFL